MESLESALWPWRWGETGCVGQREAGTLLSKFGGWASGGLLPRGCASIPGVSGVSAWAAGPLWSLD